MKTIRWFWFIVVTAGSVIWRGTWQAHSLRLITGELFAGLAVLFSYLATSRVSALVGILAYPAGLALIYGFRTAPSSSPPAEATAEPARGCEDSER